MIQRPLQRASMQRGQRHEPVIEHAVHRPHGSMSSIVQFVGVHLDLRAQKKPRQCWHKRAADDVTSQHGKHHRHGQGHKQKTRRAGN